MLNRKLSKKDITEIVLKQIPKHINYDLSGRLTVEDFITRWWYTGRNGGFRLTANGEDAFRLAEIEYYEYQINRSSIVDSYNKFLVELNKKINCPYFLEFDPKNYKAQPLIRLYDSQVAMMIGLYGNIFEYLESAGAQHDRRN